MRSPPPSSFEDAGRKVLLLPGDVTEVRTCAAIAGRGDGPRLRHASTSLVNNAAFETTYEFDRGLLGRGMGPALQDERLHAIST